MRFPSLYAGCLLTFVPLLAGPLLPAQAQAPPIAVNHAALSDNVATTSNYPENSANFASTAPSGAKTHVVVGHSIFLNTKNRLTRVYITNPDILDSFTASPTQVICTAKAPGLSSVIVWDETGELATYFVSSDVDVETLRGALKQAFPTETMTVAGDQTRIVLTGTVSSTVVADAASRIASLYTKDLSSALAVNSGFGKQVSLKVRIVEVDRSKLDQFAFNFFNVGGNNIVQTTTNQFPSSIAASNAGSPASGGGATSSTAGNKTVSITNALNFLLYSSHFNVGATIQDLETRQVLQILAEPTITALSGQKADFLAGGEFPFPVVQGGAGGLTSITIQFRPYGVKLDFTPIVNPDSSIDLKVAPEVSALDYTNAVAISGYTVPALSTRRAETEIVLKSGQSFAISGLLDKRTTDSFSKTPGIAAVPVLGQLFKSKSVNHSTTELIVIVTPTIVDPLSEDPSAGAAIPEPARAIPLLDPKTFDQSLPNASQTP
jgi:pilus assembly protein CpaC